MKCPKCLADNPDTQKFCGECGTQIISIHKAQPSITKTIKTPREELTTGSAFAGRYQIIEELGRGGMGNVYKALDKEIGEKIAIKLIKPEIASEKRTIERFRNELKTARRIAHKNVCRMHDLNREHGSYYITMEYVSGGDLKRLIRRTKRLDPGTAISIAKQICQGLTEAHSLGVVHRDLKPNNIMIDDNGNAKIMDFGIAYSAMGKGITGSGVMIGTPAYMAPEQAEAKDVDHRSDVYSLGVIMYEMVTGRLPFEGDTALSIAMKHKGEDPESPKEYNPQTSDDLSLLILKCLEKKKEDRYQSSEELLAALTMVEKGIPTTERAAAEKKQNAEFLSQKRWENSVAVLPFANMSADPEQEYFCDGIAEEIINALTHVGSLRVVARTSAFSFKGKNVNVREIGRELDVESILEGSVRKAGNRLRITTQLINVADGYHLWSERYDRELDDVFAIQDEISLAIVDKLKIKLRKKEKVAIVKRHTEDQEAFNLYLKGCNFVDMLTEEGTIKGIEYLEQASKKDPDFALPSVALAISYVVRSYWGNLRPHDAYPKAQDLIMKVLEIDDSLALAYAASGCIKTFYDWDWVGADQDFRRALELNPNSSDIHLLFSFLLTVTKRHDEAVITAKRAQELDPLSSNINSHAGQTLYFAGRSDEAIEVLKETLSMNPAYFLAHYSLALIYSDKSMAQEALTEYEKAVEYSGGNPIAVLSLAAIYSRVGRELQAEKLEKSLVERSRSEYVPPICFFHMHLMHGDFDQAAVWLDKACAERDSFLLWILVSPSKRRGVPDHPLFNDILKKWGLKT